MWSTFYGNIQLSPRECALFMISQHPLESETFCVGNTSTWPLSRHLNCWKKQNWNAKKTDSKINNKQLFQKRTAWGKPFLSSDWKVVCLCLEGIFKKEEETKCQFGQISFESSLISDCRFFLSTSIHHHNSWTNTALRWSFAVVHSSGLLHKFLHTPFSSNNILLSWLPVPDSNWRQTVVGGVVDTP